MGGNRCFELAEGIDVAVNLAVERAKPIAMLVAGGTCAGKGHFTARIIPRLPERWLSVQGLMYDDYFKDIDDPTLPIFNCRRTFDAPQSFHRLDIKKDVKMLLEGKDVRCPVYDVKTNKRIKGFWKLVKAADVIIVDGLFAIRELARDYPLAVKIYVEADSGIRLKRRIRRNKELYGISEEATRRNFYEKAQPLHEEYVACQMDLADIVVISN
jgi:uridine kinase